MSRNIWLISLTGGLLAGLAWFDGATGLIMLTAFVPFLFVYQYTINENSQANLIFLRVLPGFILFNLLTMSWIRNASIAGTVYAVMANSFLMSAVFWLSAIIHKKSSSFLGYTSLITFWLIFEHVNASISILTPWLNLGNSLGNDILFIQWYDITGVAGGTLWILLCNISLFSLILSLKKGREKRIRQLILVLIMVLLPTSVSLSKYFGYERPDNKSEFLVIQPNIDPYTEKFNAFSFKDQLKSMLAMAEAKISENTDWIILPETAIDDPFYEKNVYRNEYYLMIDSFLNIHPGTGLVTGATTMKSFYQDNDELPVDAIQIDSSKVFFEVYNTAMMIYPDSDVRFYHKSKLVPGIEQKIRILPDFLKDKIIPDLGGTMTGYGTQSERIVFTHPESDAIAAPVICYESVYGDFLTEYVRKGANVILIITNDGWWKNTAGYKQHLMFARIRAIENRRSVVRTANTGISCFIDIKGRFIKKTDWWIEDTLYHNVVLNNKLSFYSRNGDFLSRYISIFGVFILIITFIAAPLRRLREPQLR